ncbi:MAG: hypothetical protein Q9218_005383 [Villophora microphyllina]
MAMVTDPSQPLMTKALPTIGDTASQIPTRGDSRQSSRIGWYSPWPSTSSPQPHVRSDSYGHTRNESREHPEEEKSSVMDARRFTPNLHASLVSEILSLRREIETKNSALTSLEESLHNSKLDNGQLTTTVTNQEREIRSAKKELHLLETGTLEALGDLAKERDEAVESLADVRKRLEASKVDVRAYEEDARRNQASWEQDKQNWDNERRNIERKVHVAEGRLKTMVNEVAAAQTSNHLPSVSGSDMEEGIGETWFSNWSDIISTRSSSVRGRYHLSELSHNTYDTNELANLRNSTLAGYGNLGVIEPSSLTLAEELNLEEAVDEYHGDQELGNDIISPDALPEENPFKLRRVSVQSQDCKARRILGLSPESVEQTSPKESSAEQSPNRTPGKPLPPLQIEKEPAVLHRDAGTQFTPPSSPKKLVHETEAIYDKHQNRNMVTENTANQRRKRTSIPALSHDPKLESAVVPTTTSAACQTVSQPTSPPLVPMIALEPMFPDPSSISSPMMISSSTQTENENQAADNHAGGRDSSSLNTIPVIAIHPPGSRPGSSYNNVVLPPRTKNVACQATILSSWNSKSIGVQTESIRVDKRPLKIPPRLMSAAASSKPPSQSGQSPRKGLPKTATRAGLRSPPPVEAPRTRTRPPNIQIKDGHIAKLHNPLKSKPQPWRSSSPTKLDNAFAGFSDLEGLGKEVEFSDDDDFADVAPIRKTLSKVQNSWRLVPASMNASIGSRPLGRPISDIQEIDDTGDTAEAGPSDMQVAAERKQQAPNAGLAGKDDKAVASMSALPPPNVRKAALISSGALAHIRRRSGSEPGPSTEATAVPPPFPVPTRSSSRKIPISSSEGNGSPTPHTTSFISGVRGRAQAQAQAPLKNPLRKVRSAAAVPKFTRNNSRQDGTESPAITSPASTPLGSPRLPWITHSGSTPQQTNPLSQTLEHGALSSISHPTDQADDSPAQTTSVVDAIAQTMVGEWMWKYVRKRKSFGIAESPQVEFEAARNRIENNNSVRHKRWVWLAPYERTVMWSGRQPTNGSALLGKGGRKLTIQSVLDIRDDTPAPKGAGTREVFGRSILILTPQRALKFTAPSRDRHYVWLTALSFLSHSPLGTDNLAAIPPVPQAECQLPYSQAGGGARRSPRDSIRVAKSKERPTMHPRYGTAPPVNVASLAVNEAGAQDEANDSMSEAAEPPQIPRMSAHTRKRSNTGPRPGLHSAFKSFPVPRATSYSQNLENGSQRDITMSVTKGLQGIGGRPSSMTRHMSETAVTQPEPVRNDFFDAVGTVRMEAFVDRTDPRIAMGGGGKAQPGPPAGSYRTRQGRKKDMNYWGITNHPSSEDVVAQTGTKSSWKTEDPFQGF